MKILRHFDDCIVTAVTGSFPPAKAGGKSKNNSEGFIGAARLSQEAFCRIFLLSGCTDFRPDPVCTLFSRCLLLDGLAVSESPFFRVTA